jgi:outer membrane protein OmpA-like peptidoglycan-associated protein
MLRKQSEDSNWISIADMMTSLMVIFMFIAINYIMQVVEHTFVQDEIYNKLKSVLHEEIEKKEIELGPDGTIRFNSPDSLNLFKTDEAELTATFKSSLVNFIPKYWDVLTSDTSYFEYVKEIRIEGHADTKPPNNGEDSYLYNLDLSSRRAAAVLEFLREQPIYLAASQQEKSRMDFLFTSIGFSYSRALNKEKEYVHLDSDKTVNDDLSRRVEFRIVTSNERLIDAINKVNK